MSATSRELVHQTLNFENPARAPRDLWTLPIAEKEHPREYQDIVRKFQSDFHVVRGHERETYPSKGSPFEVGEYTDAWGCAFTNIQYGVIGEVKEPLVKDWTTDIGQVRFPREWLTIDIDAVNRECGSTDRFVRTGCFPPGAFPRPFERLQFIRGTTGLYMDLVDPCREMLGFMRELHRFYAELMRLWAKTDVDGLMFMDDWGSQRALLISPQLWREYFKPMYRDYAQIAHGAGKKIFMHSDGYILDIYPDLVEIGIDAVNSQMFCMGIENLKPYAGKITFWGEVDRQHLLADGTPADVDRGVRSVHANLWNKGGCIAQCEYGAAARPENVRQVFQSWDQVTAGKSSAGKKVGVGRPRKAIR